MLLALRRVSSLFLAVLFMLSLSVSFLMVMGSVAHAANVAPTQAPVTINQLTPQTTAALLGALIPLLVSLLARSGASDAVKVWLNLVLTAALGAVSALVVPVNGGEAQFGWVPFLTAWLFAFVTSTISYLGALKHFEVNDLLLAVGGLFGQKNIPGVTDENAAAPMLVGGIEVQAQDDEATVAEEFPQPDLPDAALEESVDGVDQ